MDKATAQSPTRACHTQQTPVRELNEAIGQGTVEERRATSRYNLVLPVEVRIAANLPAAESILVKTRDISVHGFYFNIGQRMMVGTEFEFSIALPIEVTGATQAFVNGKAQAVRVEEAGESHPGSLGVGALIESYQISRAESVKSE
jgi:hypothetical protein